MRMINTHPSPSWHLFSPVNDQALACFYVLAVYVKTVEDQHVTCVFDRRTSSP